MRIRALFESSMFAMPGERAVLEVAVEATAQKASRVPTRRGRHRSAALEISTAT